MPTRFRGFVKSSLEVFAFVIVCLRSSMRKSTESLEVSLEFLYRVRSALHLSAKKKQDVLNLEFIPDVAQKLGFQNKNS